MSNISHIKGALPIIARALGDKFGVEVKQGQRAQTDGKVIFIPPLSESDAVYQGRKFSAYELAKKLGIGYVVHESSHVRYTDFNANCELMKTPFGKHLINILEDIRIEKKMSRDFPGTADDLSQLTEVLSIDGFFEPINSDDHPAAVMTGFMMYKLRHDYLGQKPMAALLEQAEMVFNDTIPQGAAIKFEALIFEVAKCQSTADVMLLAEKVHRMIEQEAEKEDDQDDNENQGDQGQSDDQSSQNNQQSNPDDSNDDQDQAGDDQSQQSPDSSGDDSDSKNTQDDGQTAVDNSDSHDNLGNSSKGKESVLRQVLNATEEDGMLGDLGDVVSGGLNAIADTSTENVMANTVVTRSQGTDQIFIQRTTAAVNALKHRMQIMLQAQARSKVIGTNFGTRLRPDRLYQSKLGGNVFAKKVKQTQVNTAVKVLIDISGSMTDTISQTDKTALVDIAKESAFALAMTLDSIQGVNVSVDIFPVKNGNWVSIERLNSFNEAVRSRSGNFSKVKADGSTPMAQCLKASFSDLIRQKEPRKLLMVITDGDPDNVPATVKTIEMIKAHGVELLGLGINHNVGHLFEKHGNITNVNDLAAAMFTMMQKTLLNAA